MTTEEFAKLISELSRITRRYGADSVRELATIIRDPQSAADLATALEFAATNLENVAPRAKAKSPDRVGMSVLNSLQKNDPQKHVVIAELRELLLSGSVLQSMASLRNFARANALAIGNASSRKAAIAPFLQSIAELPVEEILQLRDLLIQPRDGDRSLSRWRDLIVKDKPEGNTA